MLIAVFGAKAPRVSQYFPPKFPGPALPLLAPFTGIEARAIQLLRIA